MTLSDAHGMGEESDAVRPRGSSHPTLHVAQAVKHDRRQTIATLADNDFRAAAYFLAGHWGERK